MRTFIARHTVPYPVEVVFAWHEHPGALDALLPAFPRIRVVRHEGIRNGAAAVMEIRLGPFRLEWEAIHDGFVRNKQFRDIQVRGPFRVWEHTHRFEAVGEYSCRLTDRVVFSLPGGRIINALLSPVVAMLLHGMFNERYRALDRALEESYAMKPCDI